jgi:hypothetical protein
MKALLYLGFLLIITGLVYNLRVLRGPMSRGLSPRQIFATTPWRISVVLVVAGVVLLLVGGQ